MQRVVRRRHQIYEEKDFQIQSLTSLIQDAKIKTHERIEAVVAESTEEIKSLELPLHHFTERLMDSLQIMHHHIQGMMMQKLGPDARNVIAAERARLDRGTKERFKDVLKKREEEHGDKGLKRTETHMANHLSDVGKDNRDELELLNDYREQYANILAELLVAKDRLINLEKALQKSAASIPELNRRISEDLAQLDERGKQKQKKRRRRSSASDNRRRSGNSDMEAPKTPEIGFNSRMWQ
jgi:hypothetical protein